MRGGLASPTSVTQCMPTHTRVPYIQSQHTPPCTLTDSYPPRLTHTRTRLHTCTLTSAQTHLPSLTLSHLHTLLHRQPHTPTRTLRVPCSHTYPHTCSHTHTTHHILLRFYTRTHTRTLTYTCTPSHTRTHAHSPHLSLFLPHPLPSLKHSTQPPLEVPGPPRFHHLEASCKPPRCPSTPTVGRVGRGKKANIYWVET